MTLIWYDGGKKPPADLVGGATLGGNGSILVGEKGTLWITDPYGDNIKLLPEDRFQDFKAPEPTLRRSPGHHREWIEACKTGSETGSNFDYASGLNETVLLGIVAFRAGKKIEWDAQNMTVKNDPAANQFIKREYRKGWEL